MRSAAKVERYQRLRLVCGSRLEGGIAIDDRLPCDTRNHRDTMPLFELLSPFNEPMPESREHLIGEPNFALCERKLAREKNTVYLALSLVVSLSHLQKIPIKHRFSPFPARSSLIGLTYLQFAL